MISEARGLAGWRALAGLAIVLLVAATAIGWQRHLRASRPRPLLINETSRHEHDLALRMSLRLAGQRSGIDNALVLLPQLPDGETIESYAAAQLTRLGVGARNGGRGLLVVYAQRENLLKIEVGYALEGQLPDVVCHRLEAAARSYMLSEVPQDFLSELLITLNLRGAGDRDAPLPGGAPTWFTGDFLSGGAGARIHGYERTVQAYAEAIGRLPPAALDAYAPAADAGTTAARYLQSLAEGVGDPRLPLLTEGSRVFRAVIPRDEAQLRRIHTFLEEARPHRLVEAGDFALLLPTQGKSNLPVVLRHGTDGRWYVDEPKAWTWFHRYEDDARFLAKFDDNPFLPAMREQVAPQPVETIYGRRASTPRSAAYPYALADVVAAAEARVRAEPRDAAAYAALGDLYLFEMNWISKAIDAYRQAEALAPDALEIRWRLFDLYQNDSRAEAMLDELAFLAKRLPGDRHVQEWLVAYRRAYAFEDP